MPPVDSNANSLLRSEKINTNKNASFQEIFRLVSIAFQTSSLFGWHFTGPVVEKVALHLDTRAPALGSAAAGFSPGTSVTTNLGDLALFPAELADSAQRVMCRCQSVVTPSSAGAIYGLPLPVLLAIDYWWLWTASGLRCRGSPVIDYGPDDNKGTDRGVSKQL